MRSMLQFLICQAGFVADLTVAGTVATGLISGMLKSDARH